jgi:kelch-like protein 2/3
VSFILNLARFKQDHVRSNYHLLVINFREVVDAEEFLTLTPEQVVKLISSDRLTVPSEEKVFECVILWVYHDLEKRQNDLALLMEHVRLPLLSQEYLVQRVGDEPLLKANLRCELAI